MPFQVTGVEIKFARASIIAEVEVSQRGLMDRRMFEDLMCSLLYSKWYNMVVGRYWYA